MRKILLASVMAALLLAAAVPASAATRAAGTVDSITLVGAPAFEATVSFSATFSKADAKYACTGRAGCARVEVLCYQAGVLVYGEAGAYLDSFLLGGASSQWVDNGGGPATCTTNLFRFDNSGSAQTYDLLATASFDAAG